MNKVPVDGEIEQTERRILLLIDGLEGDGEKRQFCELARALAELDGLAPYVAVLGEVSGGYSPILGNTGMNVNLFARKSRLDLSPVREICRFVRANKIDLIHSHLSTGGALGLIAARMCRIPIITSSIRNARDRNWKEAVRTRYQSLLADVAVANSNAGFANRFRKHRPSFRVVYNGIDPNRFRINVTEQRRFRQSLRLADDARLICMAARMEPQNDHMTALLALRQISRKHPGTVLLLAGDGPERANLATFADTEGLRRYVRFLGHRNDMENILSQCDVSLLLTSSDIHLEGISDAIMESMVLGSVVVATRGGGTDEILTDNADSRPPYKHGIKVDPYSVEQVAEAVDYLLGNESDRLRIRSNAQSMVASKFGMERFVRENIDLYRELLDSQPGKRGVGVT